MLVDSESNESNPTLSPDGRWLAYNSNETGTSLVYAKPFPNVDDDPRRVSPDVGTDPVWSPNGRELFYPTDTDLMVVQVETEPTFSSRTPEPLFSLSRYGVGSGLGRRFDIAPDGNRFIVRTLGAAGQAGDNDRFNGLIFVENWFQELTERVPVN